MKDLRCLFGFHVWEELPLGESRGNLISLDESAIRNAQLGDMKIRTCIRCGDQHRGDASRVEMRVIASAFRPSPEVKDAEEEEISEEKAAYFLLKFSEWMLAFNEDMDLRSEFVEWVIENRPEEVVEVIGITLGEGKGRALSRFIDIKNTLAKRVGLLNKEIDG